MRVEIGDIFESQAQTLVNTVNTVGVMGKGIALGFKKRFPEMHADYVRRCEEGLVKLGQPYIWKGLLPPWVINFPTKEHWRSVSRLADIVAGLEYLEEHYKGWEVDSLAVPPLGCGEGGLEWRVVGPTLYRHLARLEIPVVLFAPYGTPADELDEHFLRSRPPPGVGPVRISAGWIALVEIVARVVTQPFHWPIGRVTFQKLAYFASEAGLPTHLEFSKGTFGPYSGELKSLRSRLVNNGLIDEHKRGRMFAVVPGPTFSDARRSYEAELRTFEPKIQRVADLIARFRTTDQAEVAAAVHFVARNLAHRPGEPPSEIEVLSEVLKWKQRRRPPLDAREVAMSIRALGAMGWIHLTPSADLPVPDEELLGV
jgi:O-acetyl-ADP-ribose deacetylase (regulator of RNase III)